MFWHVDLPDTDELLSYEECLHEAVASSEIVEIGILYDRLEEIIRLSEECRRKDKSLDFLYSLGRPGYIDKIITYYLSPDVFIIKILSRKTCVMKEGCEQEICPVLRIYSLAVGKVSYARIHIECMVDIVVGIVIDGIEESYDISESVVYYFLFVCHFFGRGKRIKFLYHITIGRLTYHSILELY